MIKNMTDAELVEQVVREVLGFTSAGSDSDGTQWWRTDGKAFSFSFDPFTDMNDTQMVKDEFSKHNTWKDDFGYQVVIETEKAEYIVSAYNEPRAWLEAALTAKRGEK